MIDCLKIAAELRRLKKKRVQPDNRPNDLPPDISNADETTDERGMSVPFNLADPGWRNMITGSGNGPVV